MKNNKMFMNYMVLFGELYNKKISDTLKNAYWETLKPYNDKDCEEAFKKVIESLTFFPKPAEIIGFIKAKKTSPQTEAIIQADKIIAYLRSHGSVVPVWSNPITRYLMTYRWEYYGWSQTVLEADLPWWKKEFVESYCAMKGKIDQTEKLSTGGKIKVQIPESVKSLLAKVGETPPR